MSQNTLSFYKKRGRIKPVWIPNILLVGKPDCMGINFHVSYEISLWNGHVYWKTDVLPIWRTDWLVVTHFGSTPNVQACAEHLQPVANPDVLSVNDFAS